MQALGKPFVIGYYPSWKREQLAHANLSKYTHINMAFGIPTSTGSLWFAGDWFLSQVVADLHTVGTKVLMSVGGWTDSNKFSAIMKSPSLRMDMINAIVKFVDSYQLDGIDIDWEYPGRPGDTCNIIDMANDTPNLLRFLQDLRAAFASKFGNKNKKLITMAVRVQPFDINGSPIADVSEFAKVVDYANLMQYDINGGWNNVTGPNAPLDFEQGKAAQVSFVSAIGMWTKAGWPAHKLTAGLAFYGRSAIALEDMTEDLKNQYQLQSNNVPSGDLEDTPSYDDCAGTTTVSGTWQWKHLRDQGILVSPAEAVLPWVRQWDGVSQTPWLFNPTTKQFISYDDPESIGIKAKYAASNGLAGVMVWSVNMDYNDELVDAARNYLA
ncbi:chitinase [Coemansia spiralis]|nr:chitinase [Coemansia spiralis]